MLNKEINALNIGAYIESRKKGLTKEKEELHRKSIENKPSNSNYNEITLYDSAVNQHSKVYTSSHDDDSKSCRSNPMEKIEFTRPFFNFGESENRQKKLKDERKNDYAEYLAEREKKISAYKSSLDDSYNHMVQQKKKEEEKYRIQMGDVLKESAKKKVIEFDSDEEELFQQVLQAKNRIKSADETKRVIKLNEQKRSSTFDNSHKSYPFLSIFEDHKNSLKAEKSKQYKKELEDQIKEKEKLKMRDKLQRLGRFNSVSESYENKSFANTQSTWFSAQSKDSINANDSTKLHLNRNQAPIHYQNSSVPWTNYAVSAPPVGYMPAPPVSYMAAPPVGYVNATPVNYLSTNPVGYSASQPFVYPQTKYDMFPVNGSFTAANMQLPPTEPVTDHPIFDSGGYNNENIPRRGYNQPPGGASSAFMGSSHSTGDIDISRAKKLAYSNDLNKQMELKKLSAKKEKDERERYERKLETEVYDPWGKGGAGAPMRNAKGEIVADLRKFRNPTPAEDLNMKESNSTVITSGSDGSYDNLKVTNLKNVVSTQVSTTTTYARGAALQELKGQINNPNEKCKQDDYKMFLKQQVEEKKRRDQELKEKIRLEEEKENQRLLEQQRKMKEDFDKEKERQRQKEEELCRQNEELRLLAEQRRIKEDKKQKEPIDAHLKKETQHDNFILVPEKPTVRNNSPPVPAVIKGIKNIENIKKEKTGKEELPANLNAVHNSFSQQEALIEQLAALRKQLQEQENKVKKDLERNKSQHKIIQSSSKKHAKPFIKKGLETVLVNNVAETLPNDNKNETYNNLFDSNLLTHQEDYMREQEIRLMRLREGLEKKINDHKLSSSINNQSLLQSDSTFMSLNANTNKDVHENRYENDFKTHFKHFFDNNSGNLDNIDQRNLENLQRFSFNNVGKETVLKEH
ncbi:centrosome and spindle pole associated protein 1 isoform X5 [Hydra vulgaris]|uniref:Centrosome and spindle pole associated protein 1 isoform X5 n=1 Tax=Hydra vulgaris TaxID=6087 RepID=A0ABM4D8Y6_HYDVU